MKSYRSIDGPSKAPQKPCIAFYKYDGSNLRFEWSKKRNWYKFGTRRRLFDESDDKYGQAIPMFLERLAPGLEKVFKKKSNSRKKSSRASPKPLSSSSGNPGN